MVEPEFVRVAAIRDVPPGRIVGVKVAGEDVAIYNIDGAIHATRDSCTHEYYPLSKGSLQGCIVTCGLHQWKYDVTTGACQVNPRINVKRFEVKVAGDDIFVRLVPLPYTPPPEPSLSRDDY